MTVPAPSRPQFPSRRSNGLFASFGHAWAGLIHTVAWQRNMRIHLISGVLVGLVGSGIPLGLAEKVTLIFCVLLIFFAEILNSALEQLVDLAVQQFDEKARLTKDAAAAGVLVLAGGTVVIFAAILINYWETVRTSTGAILRQVALGVPLAACATVLVLPQPRPVAVDVLAFLLGMGLLALTAPTSASLVFTALTAALLVIAGAAARERRRHPQP